MVYYIDPWLIIVNVINIFANLYGYVTVYDSYKRHSKYPFDNYRINVLQRGSHISMVWYSILTRGLLYIENCKLCQFGWFWACSFFIKLQARNYPNWQSYIFYVRHITSHGSIYYTIEM